MDFLLHMEMKEEHKLKTEWKYFFQPNNFQEAMIGRWKAQWCRQKAKYRWSNKSSNHALACIASGCTQVLPRAVSSANRLTVPISAQRNGNSILCSPNWGAGLRTLKSADFASLTTLTPPKLCLISGFFSRSTIYMVSRRNGVCLKNARFKISMCLFVISFQTLW